MSTPPPLDPTAASDEEAYLDRLRAVDPAAGPGADLNALRASVAARAATSTDPAAVPDELAARRHSRFGRPVRLVAAAAAVLVVGSGGYAIGAGRATSPVADAAPVISLAGPAQSGDTSAVAPAPGGAERLGGSKLASTSMDAGFGGWWGRTVFTSSGLSTAGGRAEAWAMDASTSFTEATAAAAAAALGLSGAPALVNGAWQVGPTDGSGPSLTLSPDGQGTLSYYDPSVDPWACVTPAPDTATVAPDATTEPGSAIAPGEPVCSERELGAAPGSDAAAARLREVLGALGIDASSYELVAEDYGDPTWTYVTGYQVLDGQRTGVTWSAAMTGAGLSSLYGSTARLVSLGQYDVVSPTEAVARLGDPRFGATGGYPMATDTSMGVAEGPASDSASSAIAPEPVASLPPVPQAGSSFSWPVRTVEITAARLGLAMTWQQDGSVVLVPTYQLTGADGTSWSVIAVSDSALDFTAAG
mgnify:CR=1 FL=1